MNNRGKGLHQVLRRDWQAFEMHSCQQLEQEQWQRLLTHQLSRVDWVSW